MPDTPTHDRQEIHAEAAAQLARSGLGRGRLLHLAARGDRAARDALRAWRDAETNHHTD